MYFTRAMALLFSFVVCMGIGASQDQPQQPLRVSKKLQLFLRDQDEFYGMYSSGTTQVSMALITVAKHAKRCAREFMEELLKKGASLQARDIYGMTPLLWVACRDNTELAGLMLQRAPTIVNDQDDDGWTSLIWAAWRGHLRMVKLLLDAGADIRIRSLRNTYPYEQGSTVFDVAREWYKSPLRAELHAQQKKDYSKNVEKDLAALTQVKEVSLVLSPPLLRMIAHYSAEFPLFEETLKKKSVRPPPFVKNSR